MQRSIHEISDLNPIEQAYRDLLAQGKSVQKLFSGNPNEHGFQFPSLILEKGYSQYFQKQNYKPHPKGLLIAREAIANYYQQQGAVVSPENILVTAGTSESFFYLFSLLTQPGDNILTPNPAYPLFDYVADLTHIQLRQYSLLEDQNWSIDIEDLKKKTDARTKAILLISPNNPTGAVVSAAQIQELTAWANSKKIALICDEVFSEFYFGKGKFPRPMVVSQPDLCFTLNGISKMFALPALKLGWIAVTGNAERVASAVDQLETIADTFLSCHIPIQETLPLLFQEGQSFLSFYREAVSRRRQLAISLLEKNPKISFCEPQGGFYLMGQVKTDRLSEEEFVLKLLTEKNVFVHPGYFYDYEKGVHFVLSFLTEEKTLKEGLVLLLEVVQEAL